MKSSFSIVTVLALSLAAFGVACGPEESYCYDQHATCTQAQLARAKEEADRRAAEEAARDAQGGIGDGGATVIEH